MAVRFDAVVDSLTRTTNLSYPISILGWVYVSVDVNAESGFFSIGASSGSRYIKVGVDLSGTNTNLLLWDGSGVVNGSNISLGTWYHLALVVEGLATADDALVYLNGVLDITNPNPSDLSVASLLWLGNTNESQFLNGRIAAVKIYDDILTPAEIINEMRQILPFRTGNLNSFYPLNNISEDEIDFSGLGRTLTVGGTLTTEDGPPIPWKVGRYRILIPVSSGPQTLNAGSNTVTVTAPVVTVNSGAVSIAAGSNIVTVTNDATLVASTLLSADNQLVTVTAPSATLITGAVTVSAGQQTVTVTAPNATIISAANQDLSAGNQTITVTNPDVVIVVGNSGITSGANIVTITAPAAILSAVIDLLAGNNLVTVTSPIVSLVSGNSNVNAGEQAIIVTAPTAILIGGAPGGFWHGLTGNSGITGGGDIE